MIQELSHREEWGSKKNNYEICSKSFTVDISFFTYSISCYMSPWRFTRNQQNPSWNTRKDGRYGLDWGQVDCARDSLITAFGYLGDYRAFYLSSSKAKEKLIIPSSSDFWFFEDAST
jgi:hypothetical protein